MAQATIKIIDFKIYGWTNSRFEDFWKIFGRFLDNMWDDLDN